MKTCPYCGESLENKHSLVGYSGDRTFGTAVWECQDTGQRFKRELSGSAAEDAQKEYENLRPDSGEDIIPERTRLGFLRKILRILSWI